MNVNSAFDMALEEAIKHGSFTIKLMDYSEAANMRQRFYRYREAMRSAPINPLYIHADEFVFKLKYRSLEIIYSSKNNPILESLNDTESTSTREFHNQYGNSDQSKV